MEGDEDDRDRQSQAGCEHQDLPGHPAGLLLMLLPQIMPGHHCPARRQGGKNIDEQDIHRIHQRYAGNRSLSRRGYHDRIRHAYGDRQRLLDDQRDDQLLQIPVGIQHFFALYLCVPHFSIRLFSCVFPYSIPFCSRCKYLSHSGEKAGYCSARSAHLLRRPHENAQGGSIRPG